MSRAKVGLGLRGAKSVVAGAGGVALSGQSGGLSHNISLSVGCAPAAVFGVKMGCGGTAVLDGTTSRIDVLAEFQAFCGIGGVPRKAVLSLQTAVGARGVPPDVEYR